MYKFDCFISDKETRTFKRFFFKIRQEFIKN